MRREAVDNMLASYNECAARAAYIRAQLAELKRLERRLSATAIDDAVNITQILSDMPRGTKTSDPTASVGLRFAAGDVPAYIREIEEEQEKLRRELSSVEPTVVFVEAWLMALTVKEAFVIKGKVLGQLSWRELGFSFQKEFGSVTPFSKQGLIRIRDSALAKIYKIAE